MKILENLISLPDCQFLTNVINAAWLSAKMKFPGKKLGDNLVAESFSAYALPETDDLLWHLTRRVAEETGKRLVPTYSYCRIYHKGAILPLHQDRESCEYSISLKVSGDDWPIWFNVDGPKELVLPNGTGVLYKGLDTPHWRERFTGNTCIQVFFHWVDANGPYAEWRYDKRPYLTQLTVPR
jgi:hypothetical protein